jgi:hypothetical protein
MKLDVSGIFAIANAIFDMGALTKLDISSNYIGAEQECRLQRRCLAGGIELAPFKSNIYPHPSPTPSKQRTRHIDISDNR